MSDVQGSGSVATGPAVASELSNAIAGILDVLSEAGRGALSQRLELRFPETHPVGALTVSVNSMMDSLAQAQERSQRYFTELQDKLVAIEQQQAAIQELSTPIMEVWEGVLCLPVVGVVDSLRTSDMARTLLSAIVQRKARFALIDVTGIQVMDTQAVDHFIHMARAVRMLGAQCVLSGVHPDVSRTIVHMGIDIHGIETHRSMRDALRHFIAGSLRQSRASRHSTIGVNHKSGGAPEVEGSELASSAEAERRQGAKTL